MCHLLFMNVPCMPTRRLHFCERDCVLFCVAARKYRKIDRKKAGTVASTDDVLSQLEWDRKLRNMKVRTWFYGLKSPGDLTRMKKRVSGILGDKSNAKASTEPDTVFLSYKETCTDQLHQLLVYVLEGQDSLSKILLDVASHLFQTVSSH